MAPRTHATHTPHRSGVIVSANPIREFFLSSPIAGGNAPYVEALYEDWLRDPASVAPAWSDFFRSLRGREAGDRPHDEVLARIAQAQRTPGARVLARVDDAHARKQAAVLRLLTAFRSRGHLAADLDPLKLAARPAAPDLDPAYHGLDPADLAQRFDTGSYAGTGNTQRLGDFVETLRRTYSGSIGAEFMHIADHDQRRWLQERLERAAGHYVSAAAQRTRILDRLTAAEGLERYLHTKYVGQKRFSLEGGESLIPLLDALVDAGGRGGVRELVIGMAHRGRLNVLVNTLGKPPRSLFDEFEGKFEHPDDPAHSGDVKYHMGFSADVATAGGPLHVALAFNPSHLEIVNPMVLGSVRARQTRRGDSARREVLPVLIHGDAALAGQGVNAELFNLSQTRGFSVGGTVHVVINNQIGFTISRPDDARSTHYCTDIIKMINAPVLHVNGDDPEAVVFCARLAYDYRQTFKRDIMIDLVCYRRHGHNEADEPAATQPRMYHVIRALPTTREQYAKRLAADGVIAAAAADQAVAAYRAQLEAGQPVAELAEPGSDAYRVDWSPYLGSTPDAAPATAVPREKLARLEAILTDTHTVKLQPRVAKIYDDRRKMAAGEQPLDWGYAENLAYATLLDEGYGLRLVGQDSQRGTFFHRHAVLHDQDSGATLTPLKRVRENSHVEIIDSALSELAVMAFEYGFASAEPRTLPIWEGQFGDFANGAQVVVDQFISSGEAKWDRISGLTLFLPHGYEGQGPEHSSARLERYLQLCALHNMQVCVPTTPAQVFHMIRRQMVGNLRKPLIVMTPKSLLRHKLAVSSIDDLARGAFQTVIPDSTARTGQKVRRIVLCSGKVYYDLLERAEKSAITDVALVRVEQLYPFPRATVTAELERFPATDQVVWCQEEPMNQGAWFQIRHHLQSVCGTRALGYAGRARSPAPACGHYNTHVAEQSALVEQALSGPLGSESAD